MTDRFILSSHTCTAPIVVLEGESECVLHAAQDLAVDIEQVSGRRPDIFREHMPNGA